MSAPTRSGPPETATSAMAVPRARRPRRAAAARPHRNPVVLTTLSIVAGIGIWWLLAILGFRLPPPSRL